MWQGLPANYSSLAFWLYLCTQLQAISQPSCDFDWLHKLAVFCLARLGMQLPFRPVCIIIECVYLVVKRAIEGEKETWRKTVY